MFSEQIFFWPNIFLERKMCFNPKFFLTQNFFRQCPNNLIKARQVQACPELGTAQPQLVILIVPSDSLVTPRPLPSVDQFHLWKLVLNQFGLIISWLIFSHKVLIAKLNLNFHFTLNLILGWVNHYFCGGWGGMHSHFRVQPN